MFPLPPPREPEIYLWRVSDNILKQMGGHGFVVMTGAKNFVGSGDSLKFSLPSTSHYTKNGINTVRITLNHLDFYDVEFMKIKKIKGQYQVTTIKKIENVYAEDLQRIFTEQTGLDTHL